MARTGDGGAGPGAGTGAGDPETPEGRWAETRTLLAEALELRPEERDAFLRDACGDDEALRRSVESLLRHEAGAGDLLSDPLLSGDPGTRPPADGASAPGEEESGDPPPRIGPYRLLRKLGDGGMGSVYLGERIEGSTGQVAVKVLKPGLDSVELVSRFRAERRILSRLRHPYLVQLLDAGTTDGDGTGTEDGDGTRLYFVMEYVDGEPIDRFCRNRELPVAERLELFRKVCAAVHFAHQNMVLHCDLKPANVLIARDGTPKLLDFGVAKLLRRDPDQTGTLTRAGRRPVTPRYASPELLEGDPVSTASDVYSLGVLLFELLTGRSPYRLDDRDSGQEAEAILGHPPPRPSSVVGAGAVPGDPERWRRHLRGDLDVLARRALRRDPRERFASVDQMADEIGRYLQGLPIRSRPDSWLYRSGKFVRRHAVATASVALALVLLFALVGLLTVEGRRADREAAAARRAQAESEEVTRFLVDLFGTSRAAAGDGSEPTALELLDAAAGQLEVETARSPIARARLLDALGRAQQNLGHFDRARPLLEEALSLRRRELGEAHPEVARSLRSLARLAEWQGDVGGAEALYRQTLEMREDLLPAENPEVAESLADLGRILLAQPEREQALALLTRAVDVLERAPGDHRLKLASALEGLAHGLQAVQRSDEAEARLRQALALRREALGPDHPLVARSLVNLGWLFRRAGRSEEAVEAYRSAIAIQRRVLGPDHPELGGSLHDLAVVESEAFGRHDEAERLLRQALEINERAFGPDNLQVATHLDTLANVLVNQERFAESVDLFRRSVEIRKRALGQDHFTVGLSYTNVAHGLRMQGRCEEAEPFLAEARRIIESALGSEDFWAAAPIHELAACRRNQGRWEAAEKLFRRSLEILEANGAGPSHPAWREVAADFDRLLRDMKKPSEARSLERRMTRDGDQASVTRSGTPRDRRR